MEQINPESFDRVAKALIDRTGMQPEEALARLQAVGLEIVVDDDVRKSPTLQASLLTLVNLTHRVFKRSALIVDHGNALAATPRVPSPHRSLAHAVEDLGGILSARQGRGTKVVLGHAGADEGLRVTFDGWNLRVGPASWSPPLRQRERCVLAGVAGAALALGEVFLHAMEFDVEASKREATLSLWRPDERVSTESEPGPLVEFLPGEAWLLGLGHLGQGMAWALSMLPFAEPAKLDLILQDFDRVGSANVGTQALTRFAHLEMRKTNVCAEFMRGRGFDPAVMDRAFDEHGPRLDSEPALALCGFDARGPRHVLDRVNFQRVVVCGVGGTTDDFDDVQVHTLPLQERTASELWPTRPEQSVAVELARSNAFYRSYQDKYKCGELGLAGVSVAVPFVGALVGTLAWAGVLRELHGGPRAAFIGFPMRCLEEKRVRYSPAEAPRPRFLKPHLLARQ